MDSRVPPGSTLQTTSVSCRRRIILIFANSVLVDLTQKAALDLGEAPTNASLTPTGSGNPSTSDLLADEERGLPIKPHTVPVSVRSVVTVPPDSVSSVGSPDATEHPSSVASASSNFTYIKQRATDLLGTVTPATFPVGNSNDVKEPVSRPKLDELVKAYQSSDLAKAVQDELKALQDDVARGANGHSNGGVPVSDEPVDAVLETSLLRGRKRATWGTQFRILSGRAFKNLYRDPALLAAHYLSAVALARECPVHFVLAMDLIPVPTLSDLWLLRP